MSVQFEYEAYAADGSIHKGTLAAADQAQVEAHLVEHLLKPISISKARSRLQRPSFGFLGSTEYEHLIMFTTALATMHRAGVPLLQALTVMRIGKPNSRFNEIIERLRQSVLSGQMLSQVMAEYPHTFSRVYVASVAAGEESGQLENILDQLAAMLETEMELVRQIKQATRYPLIVIGVIGLAFLVMMTYVVPQFVDFYGAFGAELPLPTQIMIAVSSFITNYWHLGLIGVGAFAVAFQQFIATEKGRMLHDRAMLKIPIIGDLIIKGNIARFTAMFRILFKAGISIVKVLDVLAETIKNVAIAAEIRKLEDLFRRGRDVQSVKGDLEFMPDLALHMMAIGMESGSMEQMMDQVATHYSKDTMYHSRQLTSILEPILTLVLGVFVLIIALAIFLPMWSLIKVFHP